MPVSWNEIRHNAIKFSRDWTGAKSESAEKQTFWNEFFQVFGVSRRAVASFEEPVKGSVLVLTVLREGVKPKSCPGNCGLNMLERFIM